MQGWIETSQCSNFILVLWPPSRCDLPIINWAVISLPVLLCLWPSFQNELFSAAQKPSNSAEVSWSKLFVLVWDGGSKYHQLWWITLSSCHSLPFFDTFELKIVLIFWKRRRNLEEFAETGSFISNLRLRLQKSADQIIIIIKTFSFLWLIDYSF